MLVYQVNARVKDTYQLMVHVSRGRYIIWRSCLLYQCCFLRERREHWYVGAACVVKELGITCTVVCCCFFPRELQKKRLRKLSVEGSGDSQETRSKLATPSKRWCCFLAVACKDAMLQDTNYSLRGLHTRKVFTQPLNIVSGMDLHEGT